MSKIWILIFKIFVILLISKMCVSLIITSDNNNSQDEYVDSSVRNLESKVDLNLVNLLMI